MAFSRQVAPASQHAGFNAIIRHCTTWTQAEGGNLLSVIHRSSHQTNGPTTSQEIRPHPELVSLLLRSDEVTLLVAIILRNLMRESNSLASGLKCLDKGNIRKRA